MLKGFVIGIAFTVTALAGVGYVGVKHIENNFATAFDSMPMVDDLEAFAACAHKHDRGNAKAALDACDSEYSAWSASPTFAAEWLKLIKRDQRIRDMAEAYNQ